MKQQAIEKNKTTNSGFAKNLESLKEEENKDAWRLTINNGEFSTAKLNVILWLGTGTLQVNHDEYKADGQPGTIMVFPAFLWWKATGDYLTCSLSGNHFM